MIFSSLDARECPFTYPAAIGKALNWLKEHDLARMEPGIYEIEGKDLFVNIQDITTKPVQECRPERHHQYLDIQYIVSGREQMGFAPDNGREENCTDVEGRDVVFYQNLQEESFVTVPAGSYCIFFSNDIHRPGCAAGEAAAVRKAVVKINQKLLEQRSNTIHEERQEVL